MSNEIVAPVKIEVDDEYVKFQLVFHLVGTIIDCKLITPFKCDVNPEALEFFQRITRDLYLQICIDFHYIIVADDDQTIEKLQSVNLVQYFKW